MSIQPSLIVFLMPKNLLNIDLCICLIVTNFWYYWYLHIGTSTDINISASLLTKLKYTYMMLLISCKSLTRHLACSSFVPVYFCWLCKGVSSLNSLAFFDNPLWIFLFFYYVLCCLLAWTAISLLLITRYVCESCVL